MTARYSERHKEIVIAIYEARSFIARAHAARDAIESDKYASGMVISATKRASLDLSRALADLRRVL